MQDKTITCKDCGKEFIFTVAEQEFYQEKGFDNDPVRCKECRQARKQQNRR
ncbi:MAG: zinc-ribbon domain-containing protein [Clostridia bacterium]